jgi:putative ABC transport system permease protein
MYGRLIKNDIRKSKLITLTITAFILVSATLSSLVAILTVNMFSAINHMLVLAESPDFTRMHTGEIDMKQVELFAESHENVASYQVLEYLNIEAAEIVIGEESLAGSAQENGFSVQSNQFDFLLNLNGEIIRPADGEIYVPLYYLKAGNAQVGDEVRIHGEYFIVAGFLRDSLMNPAMASSKRFLISENDFEKLHGFGIMEYLIEFQLHDPALSASFESGYIGAGMPSDGPLAITVPLIRLMNGIEDGMMIAMLALMSILVILVAFLCIRFTLLAKVEEDYREIGVLKAIGLRSSSIKRLYMAKYGAIAGAACVLGFLLSLFVQKPFMANIHLYLGVSNREVLGILIGAAGTAVIFFIVMMYVHGVLRNFRKISPAQAVRFGAPQEKPQSVRGFRLAKNTFFSTSAFLAIEDVLARKKMYLTMFFVLTISCFIMLVPQNISNTISSPNFYTQMGMGLCDFSAYVSKAQTEDVAETGKKIAAKMSRDESIAKYTLLTTRMFEMPPINGAVERLQVALGNHDVFPIDYSQGRGPQTETEIALSRMYASDFDKTVGDEIVLIVDRLEKSLMVCGIYSDITNNGKTAKAIFPVSNGEVLNASVLATLVDSSKTETKAATERYKIDFPYARVNSIEELSEQLMGSINNSIQKVSYVSAVVAVLLTILVTLLFLKMLVTKDRYAVSVLKSLGFTSTAIRLQYIIRAAAVFILAIVIGTILANTLGELLGLALITSFGASAFQFEINPFFAYFISPLLLALCVYIAALLAAADIRRIKISEHIKEA